MTPIKTLIIEDEIIIAEDMRIMLESLGYDVIGIALDYDEGLEIIANDTPDIVLTDISLNSDKDGVDIAKEVRANFDLPLIFITSHSDQKTLERVKEVQPNGYLVKPFDKKDLYTSIEIALSNYVSKSGKAAQHAPEDDLLLVKDSIYVKDGSQLSKVTHEELFWVKSEGNYVEVHTHKKRFVVRSSMREFLDKLPDAQFFRVHKSYAVNISHIQNINSTSVQVDGELIPIGRNYKDELVSRLNTI